MKMLSPGDFWRLRKREDRLRRDAEEENESGIGRRGGEIGEGEWKWRRKGGEGRAGIALKCDWLRDEARSGDDSIESPR